MNHHERKGFTTGFGVIAAAAGSAIGLGNIWRFPYTMGQNGGSAFLIIYILFVLLLGIPLLMSEFLIGRKAKSNVLGAFRTLAPKRKSWLSVGWLSIITAFFIYSFYSVVAGWTINYIVIECSGQFVGQSAENISQIFSDFISHSWHPVLYMGFLIALTAIIVTLGVQKGIEKYCKILIPSLLIILVLLCVRSLLLPGASKGIDFLFKPDFNSLTTNSILSALGQALFSLSLGMGCLVTYGSYINKNENLLKNSIIIAIADTAIAVLAGVMIFPAVFSFGLSPTSGPTLVFEVLPNVFNQMTLGRLVAVLFFAVLSIAALTSTMSLLEIVVAWGIEELHLSRRKATILCSLIIFAIGSLCSLSFGPLKQLTINGFTIFNFLDKLTATYLMPIGSLAMTLFVGWFMKNDEVRDELSNGGTLACRYYKIWRFIIRYICPIILIVILLTGHFGFEF